ncbi:MAG: lipoyl(octanoyl) transferase LipB [Thiomargarita sp.]|nr:lipoyl(octanoyl) transferase LipB [Thiomargarita sp.]
MISKFPILIKNLGLVPFEPIYKEMQHFTEIRHIDTIDELWLLQHDSIYTLGQAGKIEHLLDTGKIPIYKTDRGGQVTYHGTGQLIVYILIDIKRRNWGAKKLVYAIEQAIINYLANLEITANRRSKAPGIYINDSKIAALGLRIRRGYTYHGFSLNVNMDLTPFQGINPCGYADLTVTQLRDFGINDIQQVIADFLPYLLLELQSYPICHAK